MHIREFTAVLIGYSHWSPSGVRSLLMQSRSLSAMGNEVAIDSAAAISKFVRSNGHCIVSYIYHSPSGVPF